MGGMFKEYFDAKYGEKLPKEEMQKKFEEYYKTKDSKLREELIVRNYELVPYVAWRISLRHGVNIDDIVGYGYEGLIRAIDTFNPNLGNSFSTYAVPCILGSIKKYIPEMVLEVSGGSKGNIYYQFSEARRIVEEKWDSKYSDNPEMLEEIIDLFMKKNGYSEEKKDYYRRLFSIRMSLDEMKEDAPELVLDFDLASYVALYGLVSDAIKHVCKNETEIDVIKYRFGLDGDRPKTLEEVGMILGKSGARIRGIEIKVIYKLRRYLYDKGVRDILDSDSYSEQDLYTNERTRPIDAKYLK